MKDLRSDLDDLCDYQAEDPDAPPWFQTKERLDRWTRENDSRGNHQPVPTLTTAQIIERDEGDRFFLHDEYDLEEAAADAMEEQMRQLDSTGDEEAVSEEVGESGENEVDDDGEAGEAVESAKETSPVQEVEAIGGAKKKPSLASKGDLDGETNHQEDADNDGIEWQGQACEGQRGQKEKLRVSSDVAIRSALEGFEVSLDWLLNKDDKQDCQLYLATSFSTFRNATRFARIEVLIHVHSGDSGANTEA
jgi:hypothetical protein